MTAPISLVADIGATNARFGLLDGDGAIIHSAILACADHPTLEDAAEAYLGTTAPAAAPVRGAIAVAGPVTGDLVNLTNHPWSFSVGRARERLGLDHLSVINDFTAVAMAVPHLGEADRRQVGEGSPTPRGVIGVLGPGTGLGVSGLVPEHGGGWRALSGEGGHATMAPVSDREGAVLAQLRKQYDHISAERVLSGMGLVNLYRAVTLLDGREPEPLEPKDVTARGLDGSSPHCAQALEMFCAMLGTVAGNLALTLGARGGVFVAGGIVPRLGSFFAHSRFRKRFTEKGRMRDYLAPIPTYVVTHPLPAFIGLKAVLDQETGRTA